MMTLEEKTRLIREAYEWQKLLYRSSTQDEQLLKDRNRCAVYATGGNIGRMSANTFAKVINRYHPSKMIDVVLLVKVREVEQ